VSPSDGASPALFFLVETPACPGSPLVLVSHVSAVIRTIITQSRRELGWSLSSCSSFVVWMYQMQLLIALMSL